MKLDYDTEQELVESFDSIKFPEGKSSRTLPCGSPVEAYRWLIVFKDMCKRGKCWYSQNGDLKIYAEESDIAHFLVYGESTYTNLHGFAPQYRL